MNRLKIAQIMTLAALGFPGSALAELKTVTLDVPSMTCSACPITVKKALKDLSGVEKVSVTFEPKEAVVTFDDKRTSVDKLREATKNAGYPSSPKSTPVAVK